MSPNKRKDAPKKPKNEGFVLFKHKLSAYKAIMGIVEVGDALAKVRLHRPKETGSGYFIVRGKKILAKDILPI